MFLTDEEKRMLEGRYGRGIQKSMMLLSRYGDAFGAEKTVPVSEAHVHFSVPLDLLLDFTEAVDRFRTQCTVGPGSEPAIFARLGISSIKPGQALAEDLHQPGTVKKRLALFRRLGVLLTCSCAGYLMGIIPRRGDILTPVGTTEQIVLNSLFGARLNAEGSPSALASAITGRTPYMGLHKSENRYARVLVRVENLDFESLSDADYSALGYYIGGLAGKENVVAVEGIPPGITFEHSRCLVGPMTVRGVVVLCHIIGITPEAANLEQAFGNKKPKEVISIGRKDLKEARESLNTAKSDNIELVTLGCTHCTIEELAEIASLLHGKKVHHNVRLIIGASKPMVAFARRMGYAGIIERAGGVFSECCVAVENPVLLLGDIPSVAATNSAKAADRQQKITKGKTKIWFGSTAACLEAAITGKWRG